MGHTNHCFLTHDALEWINGELLGDGHLQSSTYSARFVYGSKYLEYINYVSDTLTEFSIMQSGKIHKQVTCTIGYHYTSLSYSELFDVWAAWYADGFKQVPRDLKLTPVVCRQWYIGDGCLKGKFIILSTDGFPRFDVEWLVEMLNKMGIFARRQPAHNTIYIPARSTQSFLDYIGECPVECYKYKWGTVKC